MAESNIPESFTKNKVQKGILERIQLLNSRLAMDRSECGQSDTGHMIRLPTHLTADIKDGPGHSMPKSDTTDDREQGIKSETPHKESNIASSINVYQTVSTDGKISAEITTAAESTHTPDRFSYRVARGIHLIVVDLDAPTAPRSDDQLNSYLTDKHGERWMLYSFIKRAGRKINRLQVYTIDGFKLEAFLIVIRTAVCWLEINDDGQVFFEIPKKSGSCLSVLIAGLVYAAKQALSVEAAYHGLRKIKELPLGIDAGELRYVKYLDEFFTFRPGRIFTELLLSQVIVSTATGSFSAIQSRPVLLVSSSKGDTKIIENCYQDDSFIIFSFVNTAISEDVVISIALEYTNVPAAALLSLPINSLFCQAGLYRFIHNEVVSAPDRGNGMLGPVSDLVLDIVLVESDDRPKTYPYVTAPNLVYDIGKISEHLTENADRQCVAKFLKADFNPTIAKICAQLNYTLEQGLALVTRLDELGYHKLLYKSTPVDIPHIIRETPTTEEHPPIILRRDNAEPACVVSRTDPDECEITDVELIQDTVIKQTGAPRPCVSPFVRKTRMQEAQQSATEAVARPLHWVPLTNIEDTIFKEIENAETDLDYEKFEALFCEKASAGIYKPSMLRKSGTIIDPKRLFLASLSIKHLELRDIAHDNLLEHITMRSNGLVMEDLLNIERACPTQEEYELLLSADASLLSETESTMLKISRIPYLRQRISMLIFERTFCEEIGQHRHTLSIFLRAFNALLDSKGLRQILLTVLNVGNAINYKYSTRRRKSAGYKLESLRVLDTYASSTGSNLLEYILDTLHRNKVDLLCILQELEPVRQITGNNIQKTKERINELILAYRKCREEWTGLPDGKEKHQQCVLGYACRRLIEVSQMYKECAIYASIIKGKFGEKESKPIEELLMAITSFLIQLEDLHMKKAAVTPS